MPPESRPSGPVSRQIATCGRGRAWGGLAAELNGYPGPMHVRNSPMNWRDRRPARQVQALFAAMKAEAVRLASSLPRKPNWTARCITRNHRRPPWRLTPARRNAGGATQCALKVSSVDGRAARAPSGFALCGLRGYATEDRVRGKVSITVAPIRALGPCGSCRREPFRGSRILHLVGRAHPFSPRSTSDQKPRACSTQRRVSFVASEKGQESASPPSSEKCVRLRAEREAMHLAHGGQGQRIVQMRKRSPPRRVPSATHRQAHRHRGDQQEIALTGEMLPGRLRDLRGGREMNDPSAHPLARHGNTPSHSAFATVPEQIL